MRLIPWGYKYLKIILKLCKKGRLLLDINNLDLRYYGIN